QIAVCFRDEDLRADRLQEITQLDVELAFPDQEELFALMERMIRAVWQECVGAETPAPFERMSWDEAQRRYGSDKPDLRFALEIEDATKVTRGSGFGVFAKADCVRFLRVPQAFSRAELAALEELAKEWGAGGLAYIVYGDEGEARSPILKFLSEPELAHFRSEPGSTVLFGAGDEKGVARVLGQLRLELGERLALVDAEAWRFLWITDFPLLEWDADAERWDAVHHPFTRPAAADEELLEPGAARAHAYDLVANGVEIGGGSFRIHEPQLQQRIFDLLRISPEEQRAKFGFLLDALSMGAPPHGGIAFGIERMLMVLGREQNLRDTQAFPKNQAGIDPMTGAPSEALPEHLRELGIRLARPPS
ncbi:MAG: aspartate--tRNA ligase, partial [Gaiellaceae bacterium]